MNYKTLLSVDPGGVGSGQTGAVLLRYSDHSAAEVHHSWAIPDNLEGFRSWYELEGRLIGPDFVVCERFVNRNIRGADLSPLLIEGVVRWLWPEVILQPASGYKTAVSDEALKRMGMWWTGDHHSDRNSAARHALLWLKTQRHMPTIRQMYGRM